IELYPADLADAPLVRQVMGGVDLVFHFAGGEQGQEGSAPPLWANPDTALALHVLAAAEQCRVRRLVYPSGMSVYGDPTDSPPTPPGAGVPLRGPPPPPPGPTVGPERPGAPPPFPPGGKPGGWPSYTVSGPPHPLAGPHASFVPRLIAAAQAGVDLPTTYVEQ